MKNLQQTPNIGPPSLDFPNGNIVDEVAGTIGTALSEKLYGDLMVGIHKLMDLAGITQNNLSDNETNKYQLLQGFIQSFVSEWKPLSSNVDFSNVKWVTYGQEFYYHKTSVNTNNAPNLDTTNWYRVFYWDGAKIVYSNTGSASSSILPINITGNISINSVKYSFDNFNTVLDFDFEFNPDSSILNPVFQFTSVFVDNSLVGRTMVIDTYDIGGTNFGTYIASITQSSPMRLTVFGLFTTEKTYKINKIFIV